MKYLGSTSGAVITDAEVARSQRRRKLARGLLLGVVAYVRGGVERGALESGCFPCFGAVRWTGCGAGLPRAAMAAHAQRK